MKEPNFFIIGAPKCGTTSLAQWLAEHPRIYMSPVIKEPCYFAKDLRSDHEWIDSWEAYLSLFEGAGPEHLAVGEASTCYLFSKVAVPLIEETLPGAKYIVMIRNPVDMAYALHEEQLRVFKEDVKDFYTAWRLAPERRKGRHIPPGCKDPVHLDYPAWCRLGEQLDRLFQIVPRERVLVLVLDDVKEDPRRAYRQVLDFLGVPDDGRERFPVYHAAHEWRRPWLGKLIHGLSRAGVWLRYRAGILPKRRFGWIQRLQKAFARQRPRPPLPPEVRAELVAYFEEDIRRLEQLLDRDFSHWQTSSPT